MTTTSTAWAVYLGCNTPARLADEMRITGQEAYRRLHVAERAGMVIKNASGKFEVNTYNVEGIE